MSYKKYFSRGTEYRIQNTEIQDKMLRLAYDTNRLFFDVGSRRIEITDFIKSYTQAQILSISRGLPKIYIASDTARMWIQNQTTLKWMEIGNYAAYDGNGDLISEKYAPLASPAFTGTPTAPTASAESANDQIANIGYVKQLFEDKISDMTSGKIVICTTVNDLPAKGDQSKVYLVPTSNTSGEYVDDASDGYDEYLWSDQLNKYEKYGTMKLNLLGYYHNLEVTGEGNAITSVVYEDDKLKFSKGATFLTEHPDITTNSSTASSAVQRGGHTINVVDVITRDGNGHVTDVRTNTITLPDHVSKADQDEDGNNIKASYASELDIDDNVISLKNKDGDNLSTVVVPFTDNYTTGASRVTGASQKAVNDLYKSITDGDLTAKKAYEDQDGDNIKATYGAGLDITGKTVKLQDKEGNDLDSIELPVSDEYNAATVSSNTALSQKGAKDLYSGLKDGTITVNKATKDAEGNVITDTYVASATLEGKTITLENKEGNGIDTIVLPMTDDYDVENASTVVGLTQKGAKNLYDNIAGGDIIAKKAEGDQDGNNIKDTYGSDLTISNNVINLKNKNGTNISTVTVPMTDSYNVENASNTTALTQAGAKDLYTELKDGYATNAGTAQVAIKDADEDAIKETYVASASISGKTISLENKEGNSIDTIDLPLSDSYNVENASTVVGLTQKGAKNLYDSIADGTLTAKKAEEDEDGNNIKDTYVSDGTITDNVISLKNKNGSTVSTITVPVTDNYKAENASTTTSLTQKGAKDMYEELSQASSENYGTELAISGKEVSLVNSEGDNLSTVTLPMTDEYDVENASTVTSLTQKGAKDLYDELLNGYATNAGTAQVAINDEDGDAIKATYFEDVSYADNTLTFTAKNGSALKSIDLTDRDTWRPTTDDYNVGNASTGISLSQAGAKDLYDELKDGYAENAGTAQVAINDADGDAIKATYGNTLSISGNTITMTSKDGTNLSTVTVPATNISDDYDVENASTETALSQKGANDLYEEVKADYAKDVTISGKTVSVTNGNDNEIATFDIPMSGDYTDENASSVVALTQAGAKNLYDSIADGTLIAKKAEGDQDGNNIKDTYGSDLSINDHTISLVNKNGTTVSQVVVPERNITDSYDIENASTQTTFSQKGAKDLYNELKDGYAENAGTAANAIADGNGNVISETYGSEVTITGKTVNLVNSEGDNVSTAVIPMSDSYDVENASTETALTQKGAKDMYEELSQASSQNYGTELSISGKEVSLVNSEGDNLSTVVLPMSDSYDVENASTETSLTQKGAKDLYTELKDGYATNAGTAVTAGLADKATADVDGDAIKDTYGTDLSIDGHTITLSNKNGTSISQVTVPERNITDAYDVANASSITAFSQAGAKALYDELKDGYATNAGTAQFAAKDLDGDYIKAAYFASVEVTPEYIMNFKNKNGTVIGSVELPDEDIWVEMSDEYNATTGSGSSDIAFSSYGANNMYDELLNGYANNAGTAATAGTADKAIADGSGDNIRATYGNSLDLTGSSLSLVSRSGATLDTVTLPSTDLTDTYNPATASSDIALSQAGAKAMYTALTGQISTASGDASMAQTTADNASNAAAAAQTTANNASNTASVNASSITAIQNALGDQVTFSLSGTTLTITSK